LVCRKSPTKLFSQWVFPKLPISYHRSVDFLSPLAPIHDEKRPFANKSLDASGHLLTVCDYRPPSDSTSTRE
jgi:hypothetical protein